MSGTDITVSFDEPFFEGGGPEQDDYSLPVSLDGRGFLLDLENQQGLQFLRRSVQLLNTQQAQSGLDQSVTAPEVWRRPVESWHQGADQRRKDREDSLPFRFHTSFHIDPWQKFGFELLHDTRLLQQVPANSKPLLKSIGASLLVVVDTTATFYPNVTLPGEAHTLPSAVVDLTCDGQNFYVLCADGSVQKRDITGTWTVHTTIATPDPARMMLGYVKGFLIAGNGPLLLDVTDPLNIVEVFRHRLAGWTWRSASEGLSVIYLLGGMGDRWHVFGMSIKPSGAALDPPVVAATLPDGEFAYSLATYLGYVLIGVNSGWRFGMPESSGAVTYGQLIETPGPVRCFEGQDRFVWFGMSMRRPVGPATKTQDSGRTVFSDSAGLGRADLSVFVSPMTPAAASDLTGPHYGEVYAVASVGDEYDGYGKRVFSISSPTGGGVYVEDDHLCPTGYLDSGSMSFNSGDLKMGLYAQVYHETLYGEVVLEMANDLDGTFVEMGRNSRRGSIAMENIRYPRAFHAVDQRIILNRDAEDPTLGPRITRTEFRAVNVPGRATEWRIPLFVHEDTHYRNAEKTRDVVSDYDFLLSLVQSRKEFIYREGDRFWRLHAFDFTWVPYRLTSDAKTYQGTMLLTCREIQ